MMANFDSAANPFFRHQTLMHPCKSVHAEMKAIGETDEVEAVAVAETAVVVEIDVAVETGAAAN
jgi:hypothetical protein